MGDGISVTPDELRRHAGHLEAIGEQIDTAKQAGDATRPGPEAYGRLCVMVPVLLGQLQSQVVDGIAAACDSLQATAEQLRSVAAEYEAVDDQIATSMRQAGEGP